MKLKYLFAIPIALFATSAGMLIYAAGLSAGIERGGEIVMKACMQAEKVKPSDFPITPSKKGNIL
jgi:hypothetical protein